MEKEKLDVYLPPIVISPPGVPVLISEKREEMFKKIRIFPPDGRQYEFTELVLQLLKVCPVEDFPGDIWDRTRNTIRIMKARSF